MRLSRFTVTGLFGLFDHEIPLNSLDRITIIHAPNGFGKTVILKLISNFFGGSLNIYRQVEFEKITFYFEDGSTITITQHRNDIKSAAVPNYVILFKDAKGKSNRYNPWSGHNVTKEIDRFSTLEVSRILDRYVPHVQRVTPQQFKDFTTGELLSVYGTIERYYSVLPEFAKLKIPAPHPDWLENLRHSVHCRLIETQRLMVALKEKSQTGRDEPGFKPAVKTYSDEMVALVGKNLAESATLSQSLDRTFPNRLLSNASPPLKEGELRKRLVSLELRRERLTYVGLLDKSDDSALIPEKIFSETTRKILTEYVKDAEKKLDIYNSLLGRIELLVQIINRRFQFKTLSVDRTKGFVITDIKGRNVELENLSSGEQHEIVLVYDLLFNTKKDTLLLIDEPEISLHIAWQKKFLADLRAIIELTPMDIIVSTHSPQLIGSKLDLAIQLQGPKHDY